jgi:hypothetical protein
VDLTGAGVVAGAGGRSGANGAVGESEAAGCRRAAVPEHEGRFSRLARFLQADIKKKPPRPGSGARAALNARSLKGEFTGKMPAPDLGLQVRRY